MIKGFRDFLLRGNVVDLAVAVVIGAAFAKIVEALLAGFINPLIGAIVGQPTLDQFLNFTIGKGEFKIGILLTAILNFVIIAAAIYFIVIVPLQKLTELRNRGQAEPDAAPVAEDVALLTEIRDLLRSRNGSV